jgi:crossover junction endodeoxyribonuclease RuvC
VIVLGIDPGTASVGYGVVEGSGATLREIVHGCFTTSPDDPLPSRLAEIHRFVGHLVEVHGPDLMAVERVFFQRNAQTALAVGHARGVILLAAAEHGVPVREATPNEVKQAVTGHGAADKAQVQRMVQVVLGLSALPTPDDAADALAIAVWAANSERAGEIVGAAVLDRAAVGPIVRGTSSYDRAVRDALRREREAARPPATTAAAPGPAATTAAAPGPARAPATTEPAAKPSGAHRDGGHP